MWTGNKCRIRLPFLNLVADTIFHSDNFMSLYHVLIKNSKSCVSLTFCQNGQFSHCINQSQLVRILFSLLVGHKMSEAAGPPSKKSKICPSKGNL